jgi:UDP-glucose 4-epimerase
LFGPVRVAMKKKEKKKKSVLITGATGIIGRQLVHQLYHDNRVSHIFGVAIDDEPYYFRNYDQNRFLYRPVNILKRRQLNNLFLSEAFKRTEIDTVVHMAFMDRPEEPDISTHTLNVEGTKNLLTRCIEHGSIDQFIFQSSYSVYKVRPGNPILLDEEADLNFDPHASQWVQDRVDADMICRSMMDNGTMRILVLRTGPIIGRNIRTGLNRLLESHVIYRLVGFDPMVNPIHVHDVLRALKHSIFRDVQGVFNIAGLDVAPLSEFIRMTGTPCVPLPWFLLKQLNWLQRKLGLTQYNCMDFPDSLRYSVMLDTRRAREELDFKPINHIKFA